MTDGYHNPYFSLINGDEVKEYKIQPIAPADAFENIERDELPF